VKFRYNDILLGLALSIIGTLIAFARESERGIKYGVVVTLIIVVIFTAKILMSRKNK
jgi:uncharacterized membrane protein (UPF0136 family)